MTRARNRTHGLGNPPLIQLLLEAVLCVLVSLVQGARTTLQMWRRQGQRDWHAQSETSALPRATSGISSQGTHSGVTSPFRMEADLFVRVPREGGGPDLRAAQTSTNRASSALTRADQTRALIPSVSKDQRNAVEGAARTQTA